MSRPNLGPKLVLVRGAGWTRAVYHIRWTERGRTRKRSTGTSDPRRAQEAFADFLAEQRRLQAAGRGNPDQILVADVLLSYAAERGPELMNPRGLADAVEPLLAFFSHDTLATMTPGRVKEYWAWRREHSVRCVGDDMVAVARGEFDGKGRPWRAGAADGTIIRELAGALRPSIRHAIEQRRLVPGSYYVPVPPKPRGRDYWITRSEAARLLWETRRDPRARLHLPLFTLVALYTGQRRGAILDLTWKQIDLVRGRIDFNVPGRQVTNKRRPVVPVPRSLLAALRRAHARASSDHVVAYNGERLVDIKSGFNAAAERAGLPRCTSHTLRHTAGTWLAQRGVSIWEIAGYLGHSVQRTTELYAHHHPDYLSGARSALE